MFGAFGAMPARLGVHFVSPAALEAGPGRALGQRAAAGPDQGRVRPVQGQPAGERRAAATSTSTPRRSRSASTASSSSPSPPPSCPWPSATSCSESADERRCCCSCSTRGPRPAAHHHSGGMEAAVRSGLVTRPGRTWRLLPDQAPDVGSGLGRVRRRRRAGVWPATERAVVPAAAGRRGLLDTEYEARIAPSEATPPASRQLGAGRWQATSFGNPGGGPGYGVRAVRGTGAASPAGARGRRGPAGGGRRTWPRGPRRSAACAGPASAAVRLLGLDPFAVQAMLARLAPGGRRVRGGRGRGRRACRPSLPADAAPALDLLADYHLHRGGASVCVLSTIRPSRRAGRRARIGIGGPVGSGKTALVAALCRALAGELVIGVVTNDIYTTEDADFLRRAGVLPDARILRRADRRLPAHRHPRRHQREPGRGRAARRPTTRASTWSWSRAAATT